MGIKYIIQAIMRWSFWGILPWLFWHRPWFRFFLWRALWSFRRLSFSWSFSWVISLTFSWDFSLAKWSVVSIWSLARTWRGTVDCRRRDRIQLICYHRRRFWIHRGQDFWYPIRTWWRWVFWDRLVRHWAFLHDRHQGVIIFWQGVCWLLIF